FRPKVHTATHGSELTGTVIGAAFEVQNVLGCGFLEKVYERALIRELELQGWPVCNLRCRSRLFTRDDASAITLPTCWWRARYWSKLKCVDRFANEHIAQCINYLKASRLKLALLINFQR